MKLPYQPGHSRTPLPTVAVAQHDLRQHAVGPEEKKTSPADTDERWLWEMKRAYRDPRTLADRLQLPQHVLGTLAADHAGFPCFAPHPFVNRMKVGQPDDPLLKQVWPVQAERHEVGGFETDPVHDLHAQLQPGIIQKYHARALLIVSGACAVHCRYCFRRHFPYAAAPHSVDQWRQPLTQLAVDREITELILSGGDPLTLRDATLADLMHLIRDTLPQLRRIRVHTRLPVVIPARVTSRWLRIMADTPMTWVVVVHINHAQEIDTDVRSAISSILDIGALVFNQAVLLRGVNDQLEDQVQLSEALVAARITPYYLHQLDRVRGAAHFEVPISEGRQLVAEMRSRLPGYMVPQYVRDIPGQPHKQRL